MNDNYNHGLEDTLELQRRWNELVRLTREQIRQSASEDPFEQIRQIAETEGRSRVWRCSNGHQVTESGDGNLRAGDPCNHPYPAGTTEAPRPKWVCTRRLEGVSVPDYRPITCPNCQRNRVESDGVCEKCLWDVDGADYASITRPDEYDAQGYIFNKDENPIL